MSVYQDKRYFLRKPSEFNENYRYLSDPSGEGYEFNGSSPTNSIPLKRHVAEVYEADIDDDEVEIVKMNVKMVEVGVIETNY